MPTDDVRHAILDFAMSGHQNRDASPSKLVMTGSRAALNSHFGNALDNALSAVRRLPDPEQRSISVIVRRHGSMVSIHVENRFEGHLVFENGLPVTTNSDKESHGFGTKSMRLVAQKYEGTLTMSARNGLFQTDIIMPIPN